MVRPPYCDKLNVKRGLWTAEEDNKMLAYVSKHGTGNWTSVPKKAGLRRCGKSCRLRWTNYLRPNLRHESFTPQEEELIIKLHATIGSRWSIIAQQLPGRTDNDVKNYWNTKLRKKLTEMGIDHVTHKPFSQVLADYGNISGIPKPGNQIGSLNRDLKNAFMLKSGQSPIQPEGFAINTHFSTGISPPKTEPIQDSFLNTSSSSNYANSSLDLLAQLQSITLVTEASNCTHHKTIPPQFYSDSSSSSSSPSSSSSTANQVQSPQSFSWREFLLEDAFLPANAQEQENMGEFPPNGSSSQHQNEIMQNHKNTDKKNNPNRVEELDYNFQINSFEASSSSSTFVEAILDQQNDLLPEYFPSLLEESFFY